MEQPPPPNSIPQTPPKDSNNNTTHKKPSKKKLPTPQELISHYQNQGLDSQEASIKVIEDLQNVLLRVVSTTNRNKKDKFMAETSRKVDVLNNRVGLVDMKVDSKPGYVETFAIGVTSGAALKGIERIWPHVVEGIAQIWSSVRSATKSPPSSS